MTSTGARVVVVACGSFNPITFMHLRLFELAGDRLRKAGFAYQGGIISPVHDAYGKKGLVASTHRLAMCRSAVSDYNDIQVDSWEVEQCGWTRTRETLDNVYKRLNSGAIALPTRSPSTTASPSSCTGEPIGVRLVCGTDLVDSFLTPNLWADSDVATIVGDYGLVVIEREGYDLCESIAKSPILTRFKDRILSTPAFVRNEISSTKVREAVADGRSIRYLVQPGVVRYIEEHNLYLKS